MARETRRHVELVGIVLFALPATDVETDDLVPMADESIGSRNVATVSASGSRWMERDMDSDLVQVKWDERAIGSGTHAEWAARVQHEQARTIRSDLAQHLDAGHVVAADSMGSTSLIAFPLGSRFPSY